MKVRPTKLVTSVKVEGQRKPRRVFYVQREILFDAKGRVCHTPLELGVQLADAINRRDIETVNCICWDALNFVYDGKVPKDWNKFWKKHGPIPLAI